VVTTNVGGIPYLVTDEQHALLVPPDDAAAMAAAVQRVLTTPPLAAQLSRTGRSYAQQFDWETVLPQWQALLDTLLQQACQTHAR
jgi:glycosyltransferase involved in cell wall biosynthesis